MATWKKVLVEGADLQSTTDFTNNSGDLGVGNNGGISLNGAVADITNVLLGTGTVNIALNIDGLQTATPDDGSDLLAFHDDGTGLPKKASVTQFANLFAGTSSETGLANSGPVLEVDIDGQTALGAPAGTELVLVWNGTAFRKTTIDDISTAGSGDVTSVTGGAGLTGTDEGGPDVTLNVGAGDGITVNANDVALASTTAGAGLAFNTGVLSVGAGALIDVQANQVDVDLTEATAATIAAGDFVVFLDGGTTGTHAKGSINDVATLFAGDGLTATDGVIAVDDVELGTGTTGNYASAVTAGANIAVSGTAGEGTSFEVALATNVDVAGTLDVTGNTTLDGDLSVAGDLNITGEINRTSVTELAVTDKTISVAVGATTPTTIDSSGLIVDASGVTGFSQDASVLYKTSSATFSEWQMTKSNANDSAWVAGMAVGTSQSDLNTNHDCGLGSLGWDGTNLYIQTA